MYNVDENVQEDVSPWLLRFELNRKKLMGSTLSISTIEDVLRNEIGENLNIVRSEGIQNIDEKLVLRLRLPKIEADENDMVPMLLRKAENFFLNEMPLKGIPDITKVSYSKEQAQYAKIQYDPLTGKKVIGKDAKWIIETDGCALKQIMNTDKVDFARTTSNSVREVLMVLGIEAAR